MGTAATTTARDAGMWLPWWLRSFTWGALRPHGAAASWITKPLQCCLF